MIIGCVPCCRSEGASWGSGSNVETTMQPPADVAAEELGPRTRLPQRPGTGTEGAEVVGRLWGGNLLCDAFKQARAETRTGVHINQ